MNTPATVTYAFRATSPVRMPGLMGGVFSRFNAQQIVQTERALQSWSDAANITFSRVGGDGYADDAAMLFGNFQSETYGPGALTYRPGPVSAEPFAGSVWINGAYRYNSSPELWGNGRTTLVHEIGHAIGLAHPGDYSAISGGASYESSRLYFEDSAQYTIMSYGSEVSTGAFTLFSSPAAPMLDDIAAVQRLYGINTATRTGDTTYGFNSNADRDYYKVDLASQKIPTFAIWDAGGNDTLDFSGYPFDQMIDLREGAFSNLGIGRCNVAIAVGTVIERAIGGSGADVLRGNDHANTLIGNGGNDILYGGGGQDQLIGGPGADRFVFGALSDSTPAAPDHILDFAPGEDIIDLSGIDANTHVPGDQAFVFVPAFSHRAGQATLSYDASTRTTTLRLDVNGDAVADFALLVNGRLDAKTGWLP